MQASTTTTMDDPREYRRGPSGLFHIVRTTPVDAAPWSATNRILMQGRVPSYCGRDITDLPVATDEVHVCTRCDVGYFTDEDAE